MHANLNSLVMYKRRPARISRAGEKLSLDLPDGPLRVRRKDVVVLHPGPVEDVSALKALEGDPATVWEILDGQAVDLRELAELAFGRYTPETALACWRWVEAGTYFTGRVERVAPAHPETLRARLEAGERQAQQQQQRATFMADLRRGVVHDRQKLTEVEHLAWGRADRSPLLAALGRPQTPQEAHALLLELGLWNEQVNPYAARQHLDTRESHLSAPDARPVERLDLTHLEALAIDEDSTLYPDDAISLEQLDDGWRLWVHVADVAARVPVGSALDLDARGRGATLYLPESATPMLPRTLSREVALGLDAVSPALSILVEFTPDFRPTGSEVHLTQIRATRLSFQQAQAGLESGDDLLNALFRLTMAHRQQREEAGACIITLPQVRLRLEEGEVQLQPEVRLDSHRLVEEAMLLAGWGAARWGTEEGLALPFVTQAEPLAQVEGNDLPAHWARRKATGRTATGFQSGRHVGLGLECYARVTSPLRRYSDLLAQQQIRAVLLDQRPRSGREVSTHLLHAETGHSAVRAAQRSAERHWTLVYLQQRPGWTGQGVAVGQKGRRTMVLIPELAFEFALPFPCAVGSLVELTCESVDLPRLRVNFTANTVNSDADFRLAAD
jgi:exoribonuclease-2